MAEFIPNDTIKNPISNIDIIEKILETKGCVNRNNITATDHDMYKKLIYRIVDGKHDFEGGSGDSGRSYITSKHCNDSILTKQLIPILDKPNIDIKDVWIGKTLYNNNGKRANLKENDDNLFFSSLTDGANSIHPILDFISNIESIPYKDGQYIKIDVGYPGDDEQDVTLFTFCMNRPFVGYYNSTPKNWSTQLIADRNMYGKNAIYKIIIGDKKALKHDKNSNAISEKRNDINNIFQFNEHAYTIDASSLNKDDVLQPLFGKSSENIFGDAFDPSSIINGQTHGVLSDNPYKGSVNFHFCFLRGKSIKIDIKIVTTGQFEIQFSSGTTSSTKITYPTKPISNISGLAPSVADISLFIRDKIINMKTAGKNKSCFASLLATASKVIGKIKGQVPKDTNARVQYFTKFYFDIISEVETVVGGIKLDINEIMVVLTSIKTIGDQLRLKDALILKQLHNGKQAYCVSLDSFLRDSADGECNLLGDINSKKNFELVIHEKIDLEAQLKALEEVYNAVNNDMPPPLPPDNLSDADKIAWYTTKINEINKQKREEDEQKRKTADSTFITNIFNRKNEVVLNAENKDVVKSNIESLLRFEPNLVSIGSGRNTTYSIHPTKDGISISHDILFATYKYLSTQYYGLTMLGNIIDKDKTKINMDNWKQINEIIDFCVIKLDTLDEPKLIEYNNDCSSNHEYIIDAIITINNRISNSDKTISNTLKMIKTMPYLYRINYGFIGKPTILKHILLDNSTHGGNSIRGGNQEPVLKEYENMINKYQNVHVEFLENGTPELYFNSESQKDIEESQKDIDVDNIFYMDTIDILDYLYKLSLDEDNVPSNIDEETGNKMDVVNSGDNETDKFEQLYDKIEHLPGFNQFVVLLKQILQIPDDDATDMYNVEQIIDIVVDETDNDVNNVVKEVLYYIPAATTAAATAALLPPPPATTPATTPAAAPLPPPAATTAAAERAAERGVSRNDERPTKRQKTGDVLTAATSQQQQLQRLQLQRLQQQYTEKLPWLSYNPPPRIPGYGGKRKPNNKTKKKSTKRKQTRRISYIKHKQTRKKSKSNKTKSNKKFKK